MTTHPWIGKRVKDHNRLRGILVAVHICPRDGVPVGTVATDDGCHVESPLIFLQLEDGR